MYKRKNSALSVFLLLFVTVFIVIPLVSSCGKNGTSPTSNIQYQIVNLNSGIGSVDLYINYIKVNTSSYFYPTASGYFYLNSTTPPFQIRPGTSLTVGTVAPSYNFFSLDNILIPNTRYTLMITGTGQGPDSLNKIFLTDTAPTPTIGRGKVRFVNASPGSTGFDVTANTTPILAFDNLQYLKVSDYIELPAGNYDFQIFPHGSSTIVKDIPVTTIQDGRLYTFYCYGLVGHTDSLAFGSGFITNQ